MRPSEALATSRLIKKVVLNCTIYNDRAKKGEIAKYTPAELRSRLESDADSVMVAAVGRKIVGFCLNKRDDGLLLLEWYGVDPSYREHGVGRHLLDKLISSARRRGCHKLWCDTHVAATASAKVLCSLGFQPLCTLHNHWYGQDFTLWERLVPAMAVVRDEDEGEGVANRSRLQSPIRKVG